MRQSHICIDLVTCLAVCVHCSIQLSPKPDSSIHIPSVTTNTGSLPDLSGLQFTSSPPDDSTSDSTYHHIGPMRSSVGHSTPASRHGRARPGPKPLVLHSPSHTAYQVTAHDAYIHPFCPGLPRWAGTRKVKPIWILRKRETVSGGGISWAICKSAPRSGQITTPAPHHSVFTGRMPFLPPNQQHQSNGAISPNTAPSVII